jgi:O-antigen/teichoic acid export membrane protein
MTGAGSEPTEVPVAAAVPSHPAGRQAGWTIADQLVVSATNFLLTIAVARAVDARTGGAFTYALLVFTFGLGLMRTIATDPLVIRFSAASRKRRTTSLAAAAGAGVLLGLVAALLSLAAGLVAGGDLGLALVLLAVVFPGHFLQDSWRSAAFTIGHARAAAVNDVVRMVCQVLGIALCIWAGTDDLAWYMATWAASAWVAALVGVRQFGRPGSWRRASAWLRENTALSLRLGGDYAVNIGGITLTTSLLAALLGLTATGGLRFAQTLLGPIQVLFGAVAAFMVPMLVRLLTARGPQALRRPAWVLSLGCLLVSITVVGLLLLLPESIGRELLGDSWDNARAVLLPVGVTQSAIAIALGGGLPLKAMGRADLLLRVTLFQAPLVLGLSLGGAFWSGIEGAAWGIACGQSIGSVLLVVLAHRTMTAGRVGTLVPRADEPA